MRPDGMHQQSSSFCVATGGIAEAFIYGMCAVRRLRSHRPDLALWPDRLRQLPRRLVCQRRRHRTKAPHPVTLARIRPVVVARWSLHRLSIRTPRTSPALGHECRWIGAAPADPGRWLPGLVSRRLDDRLRARRRAFWQELDRDHERGWIRKAPLAPHRLR